MKQLVQIIMVATVAIGAVALIIIADIETRGAVTIQEQPQREKYVAPEWVTNERGQRCIKQGDIVTCG